MNVLITGAFSNIAFEVGMNLAVYHHVYLAVHTNAQLDKIKDRINNDNISVLKIDITNKVDYKAIDNLDIDLFIANAAIGIGGSILAMDMDDIRYNYEVNVFSNFELIKYVYNIMNKKNGGRIFIMSSLASMLPIEMLGSYTSTKASISMLATTIHKELKFIKSKVKISLIEPGAYHTGFNQVMIDNKEKYLLKDNSFYHLRKKFTKRQRFIFNLIERKKNKTIVNKIVKEANKKKSKFKIRAPLLQVFFTKIYLLLFR